MSQFNGMHLQIRATKEIDKSKNKNKINGSKLNNVVL